MIGYVTYHCGGSSSSSSACSGGERPSMRESSYGLAVKGRLHVVRTAHIQRSWCTGIELLLLQLGWLLRRKWCRMI